MDDSPVERELIRSYLPSVEVPELPEDPSYYKDILLDSFALILLILARRSFKIKNLFK